MKGQDPALCGGGWPVRQISAKSLWPPKLSEIWCARLGCWTMLRMCFWFCWIMESRMSCHEKRLGHGFPAKPQASMGEICLDYLSPWIMVKKQESQEEFWNMSMFCREKSILSQVSGLNWFAQKLQKMKTLFNKRTCLKIQAHLSRLLGWVWMFPCQTCNQLVSLSKKLII